ncbi:AAA domain-containing protein [Vibrio sp. PP-XX7]
MNLLIELLQSEGRLEDIYIISPFKAVKEQVKSAIKNSSTLNQLVKRKHLNIVDFLKKHIGTVHTFQGKENETVIFVLGCDQDHQGALHGLLQNRNLLNVAVTRAKKNLFLLVTLSYGQNSRFLMSHIVN